MAQAALVTTTQHVREGTPPRDHDPKRRPPRAMRIKGDMMAPTLKDGDFVVTEPADAFVDDGIYVLDLPLGFMIHRVQSIGRALALSQDNPASLARTEVTGEWFNERVVARVLALGTVIAVGDRRSAEIVEKMNMQEQPRAAQSGAVIPFDFEGRDVRAVTREGEPWFVAADVCAALGIANNRDAIAKLDDDEKGVASTDTPGGRQDVAVINESGLYTLVLRCRDAMTPGTVPHRFRKWATAEVLPAIRKTGGYLAAAPDETPEALALRALTVLQATVERQKAQLAIAAPKAEALDRIAAADGSFCITDAAKALQVRPKDLFDYLRSHGWIYRRPGSAHDLGYQARVNSGDLEHKVTTVLKADGSEKVTEQVRVTAKGLAKLGALMSPPTMAA